MFVRRFRNCMSIYVCFFKQLLGWNDENDRLEATREKEERQTRKQREKKQPTQLEGSTERGRTNA
jgi:hypothetical protein